jgi:hypothetical protein
MAYLTRSQAIQASRAAAPSRLVESELRKSASTPQNADFDIFLSHAYEDAEVIHGVYVRLQREGLSVYLDWLADPQADRSRVTPETARLLRTRMNHSRFLLYASSHASSSSKWMPWELGYFDGRRPGHLGILPIVAAAGAGFVGLEYLGLYPRFELIDFVESGISFAHRTTATTAERLATLARR